MLVEAWVDVVCPWAYLSQDRTALLREVGCTVRLRPFELHPDLPVEGIEVRPGGRLEATFARVGEECRAAGLPFHAPSRLARSRAALEWAEAVAITQPALHDAVFAELFRARFVEDADPADPGVRARIATALGLDHRAVDGAVHDGRAGRRFVEAREAALDAGIAATPAWRFPNGFVIPGVQPRDQVRRWAERLVSRATAPPGTAGRDR